MPSSLQLVLVPDAGVSRNAGLVFGHDMTAPFPVARLRSSWSKPEHNQKAGSFSRKFRKRCLLLHLTVHHEDI